MNIDIQKVARLARLSIPEDKQAMFAEQMQNIVNMAADLPDITENQSFLDETHPMTLRPDVVTPSLSRAEILQNAPETQAGCVVVPKTVES